jgi:hypothetical protein
MTRTEVPGYGEVLSFTTLHSPPSGFASPLHMALVEMEGGVRFFCHGTATRGLKVGSRVSIEAVDQIYYFSMLGLGERARLFWRRGGIRATQRLAAFARSAAKRLARTATEGKSRGPNGGANGGTTE